MRLPKSAKPLALLLGLLAFFVYLVLVDLGVNAGRVHYGVRVDGYEVGGHTFTEAVSLLTEHGNEVANEPIAYRVGSYRCQFTPKDVGWGPQPHDTAELAMSVGRPLAAFDSIPERIDAWLGGARVSWADSANPELIEAQVERCQEKADRQGVAIDVAEVRALLGRI